MCVLLLLWEDPLAVKKPTPTKALGPKMKTNASSITFASMVKAVGVLSLRLLVCISSKQKLNFLSFFLSFSDLINLISILSFSIYILGLLRCGKSCRLRWINYLRPDLKRGNFTEDEDELIIKLHSLLGNKYVSFNYYFSSFHSFS